jgi:hypothetical protein
MTAVGDVDDDVFCFSEFFFFAVVADLGVSFSGSDVDSGAASRARIPMQFPLCSRIQNPEDGERL